MENHHLKVHKTLPVCFSSFDQRIYFPLCNGRLQFAAHFNAPSLVLSQTAKTDISISSRFGY